MPLLYGKAAVMTIITISKLKRLRLLVIDQVRVQARVQVTTKLLLLGA